MTSPPPRPPGPSAAAIAEIAAQVGRIAARAGWRPAGTTRSPVSDSLYIRLSRSSSVARVRIVVVRVSDHPPRDLPGPRGFDESILVGSPRGVRYGLHRVRLRLEAPPPGAEGTGVRTGGRGRRVQRERIRRRGRP